MTETETKAEEVRAELYPLSKTEFETLYDKAWENGWVYGKFFQELYIEYMVNWDCFIDYIEKLKMYNPKEVEILIGEAPPYWKGNAKDKDKSYFYNPAQTKNSSWLNVPVNWKSGVSGYRARRKAETLKEYKIDKLNFLAQQKVVLLDIFPFPIIQDPKVRTEITGDYAYHIKNYFLKKYSEIIKYIDPANQIQFTHGLVATELGALQFLCDKSIFGLKGYSVIVDNPIEFIKFTCIDSWTENMIAVNPKNPTTKNHLIDHYNRYKGDFIPIVKRSKDDITDWSDKLKFVRKLFELKTTTIDEPEICEIFDRITKLPIFMKGQNVVFSTFINGTTE